MDIKASLKELDRVATKLEDTQQMAAALELTRIMKASEIRKAVRDGSTTGDHLLDLCIICYGDMKGKKKPLLEAIEAMITPHPREMVLIVSRFCEQAGCTGLGGKGYQIGVEICHLGLMSDSPQLVSATDKLWRPLLTPSIAVERSVLAKHDLGRPFKWQSSENAMAPRYETGIWPALVPPDLDDIELQIRENRMERGWTTRDSGFLLELIIGDTAVEQWFELRKLSNDLTSGRQILGYDKITPALF